MLAWGARENFAHLAAASTLRSTPRPEQDRDDDGLSIMSEEDTPVADPDDLRAEEILSSARASVAEALTVGWWFAALIFPKDSPTWMASNEDPLMEDILLSLEEEAQAQRLRRRELAASVEEDIRDRLFQVPLAFISTIKSRLPHGAEFSSLDPFQKFVLGKAAEVEDLLARYKSHVGLASSVNHAHTKEAFTLTGGRVSCACSTRSAPANQSIALGASHASLDHTVDAHPRDGVTPSSIILATLRRPLPKSACRCCTADW